MKHFAVIGNPIKHSKSPTLFSYWFAQMGINAEYSYLELDKDIDVATFRKYLQKLDGANITAPFKHLAYLATDNNDYVANSIKAVNTIINTNGSLQGYNTDVYGVDYALQRLNFEKVLVLGAGMAAAAAVYALTHKRKNVAIYNRTASKAKEIAKIFKNSFCVEKDDFSTFMPDVIINTVSNSKFVESVILHNRSVFLNSYFLDAVYPLSSYTHLLDMDKYIRGEYWLVGQAIKNFKLFTGKQLPMALENRGLDLLFRK